MALNEARLIMLEANQLPDATTIASLDILQSTAVVSQTPKILGPKVRMVATKTVALKVMVVVVVGFIGRPMFGPMPWMPMISRCIQLMLLREINQVYLVIILIGLMKTSQKVEFKNCFLYSIV